MRKLYLFDLDGTLSDMNSTTLYPDAARWIQENHAVPWMVVSNQGGVGLRHWMETGGFGKPDDYPTEDQIWDRLHLLFPSQYWDRILVAYAYQSRKTGQWSPVPYDARMDFSWDQTWRKPAPGMLLYAMTLRGTLPEDTVMVGDSEEDHLAASAAKCDFIWAYNFFGRANPE